MKLKIQSEKGFIEQIKNFQSQDEDKYSGNLHSSLSQLVQIYMRKIAQEPREFYAIDYSDKRKNLVKEAINLIKTELQEKLKELKIEFKFTKYFNNIEKVLDFPAKEINELGTRLLLANKIERIGHREKLDIKGNIPIEIIELGLRSSIDGLLVNPLLDTYEIDLENVEKKYDLLKSEWYPFEVLIDDLIFTIDDDGTIFVSAEKMSERTVIYVKTKLRELANELYVPIK